MSSIRGNMQYEEHLFDNTTDGYIQIAKFNDGSIVKIYNTRIKGLREIVEKVNGSEDSYITPNTTYIPKRRVSNIRQFRALYIDLDKIEHDQEVIYNRIFKLSEDGEIPKPTMIVDSGRGLHIYWRIYNAPYQALDTWQQLEDFLYYKLKEYGADGKALDAVRVLRIPGTVNSKNNKRCSILYVDEDLQYSMYDLREKYLKYKPKKNQLEFHQTKKEKNNVITNKFFTSYSLHSTRAEDIKTLCKLRNYDIHDYNCRNMVIHCYAYWIGLVVRNTDELEKEVIELNNAFTKPLKESEIKAVLRCIPKVIDKFIMYENDVKAGIVRRVSKGMRDKEGYWYKNETLIERLDITEEEQKHLKTIISRKEKYRRNKDYALEYQKQYEKAKRRNEEGLTSREQQKKDTIAKIKELKTQGLNNTKIAEALNISRVYVSKVINNKV